MKTLLLASLFVLCGHAFAADPLRPYFSCGNRQTVLRYFRWVRDYGIDGAFVQRFANGLAGDDSLRHKNSVLSHAREGANRAGRTHAVTHEGLSSDQYLRLVSQR